MDETHNAESYWICGVVVNVDQVRSAQSTLAEVAEQAANVCELDAAPELHGHDLWQGAGDFVGVPPRLRVGIYADALDVLAGLEPVVVIRGVRRKKIRYLDPHRLAWRYAIESIDERGGEGPILIVADEHAATEQALRGDIRTYISGSTGGWKPRTISWSRMTSANQGWLR